MPSGTDNLKARKGKGLLISLIILPREKWSPKEKEMDRPPRNFPASKHKIRQSFSINIEKDHFVFISPETGGTLQFLERNILEIK